MIFPPLSNELCTNVQVELTIPPTVVGWGMRVKTFKIIQILTSSTSSTVLAYPAQHFKCPKFPFDKNCCYYHFSNIQFSAVQICSDCGLRFLWDIHIMYHIMCAHSAAPQQVQCGPLGGGLNISLMISLSQFIHDYIYNSISVFRVKSQPYIWTK